MPGCNEIVMGGAFNCCEHQKLPLMKGSPPLKLHIDHAAPPIAVHVPAQVPLHWQLPVKAGLDRDCRLGVLERVPLNIPTKWQHRMVVVAKHDGSPRRTVDYRNLNKHTPRQTHHTPSPWSLASSIPPGSSRLLSTAGTDTTAFHWPRKTGISPSS